MTEAAILVAFVAGLILGAVWQRLNTRLALREASKQAAIVDLQNVPKLDVLKQHPPVRRECNDCGKAFDRHPAMVSMLCDACTQARFEATSNADRDEWTRNGEIVARDWQDKQ
jgi:hypothetical protein